MGDPVLEWAGVGHPSPRFAGVSCARQSAPPREAACLGLHPHPFTVRESVEEPDAPRGVASRALANPKAPSPPPTLRRVSVAQEVLALQKSVQATLQEMFTAPNARKAVLEQCVAPPGGALCSWLYEIFPMR